MCRIEEGEHCIHERIKEIDGEIRTRKKKKWKKRKIDEEDTKTYETTNWRIEFWTEACLSNCAPVCT